MDQIHGQLHVDGVANALRCGAVHPHRHEGQARRLHVQQRRFPQLLNVGDGHGQAVGGAGVDQHHVFRTTAHADLDAFGQTLRINTPLQHRLPHPELRHRRVAGHQGAGHHIHLGRANELRHKLAGGAVVQGER